MNRMRTLLSLGIFNWRRRKRAGVPGREVMRMEADGLAFRRMTLRDLDDIMAIERASFTAPWSRGAFTGELTENHFARYLVMAAGERTIGYGGMWVIVDEAHVTNIAVLPAFRGRRYGERLLRRMMAEAIAEGARRMTLEVRVSNAAAQNLYRKLGFRDGGIRRGYYTDNREDALVMWMDLPALSEVGDAVE